MAVYAEALNHFDRILAEYFGGQFNIFCDVPAVFRKEFDCFIVHGKTGETATRAVSGTVNEIARKFF